jgi:hypothetical protein
VALSLTANAPASPIQALYLRLEQRYLASLHINEYLCRKRRHQLDDLKKLFFAIDSAEQISEEDKPITALYAINYLLVQINKEHGFFRRLFKKIFSWLGLGFLTTRLEFFAQQEKKKLEIDGNGIDSKLPKQRFMHYKENIQTQINAQRSNRNLSMLCNEILSANPGYSNAKQLIAYRISQQQGYTRDFLERPELLTFEFVSQFYKIQNTSAGPIPYKLCDTAPNQQHLPDQNIDIPLGLKSISDAMVDMQLLNQLINIRRLSHLATSVNRVLPHSLLKKRRLSQLSALHPYYFTAQAVFFLNRLTPNHINRRTITALSALIMDNPLQEELPLKLRVIINDDIPMSNLVPLLELPDALYEQEEGKLLLKDLADTLDHELTTEIEAVFSQYLGADEAISFLRWIHLNEFPLNKASLIAATGNEHLSNPDNLRNIARLLQSPKEKLARIKPFLQSPEGIAVIISINIDECNDSLLDDMSKFLTRGNTLEDICYLMVEQALRRVPSSKWQTILESRDSPLPSDKYLTQHELNQEAQTNQVALNKLGLFVKNSSSASDNDFKSSLSVLTHQLQAFSDKNAINHKRDLCQGLIYMLTPRMSISTNKRQRKANSYIKELSELTEIIRRQLKIIRLHLTLLDEPLNSDSQSTDHLHAVLSIHLDVIKTVIDEIQGYCSKNKTDQVNVGNAQKALNELIDVFKEGQQLREGSLDVTVLN